MKRIIAVTAVIVFAALLCQVAFCQERPGPRRAGERAQVAGRRPQNEEVRKLMERLREINQNEALREVTAEARKGEGVQKAYEGVRKAQEALRKAQEDAAKALDAAVMEKAKAKGSEELVNLVKERNKIREKLQSLRGQFGFGAVRQVPGVRGDRPGRTPRGPRDPEGRPERPRRRPAQEEAVEEAK